MGTGPRQGTYSEKVAKSVPGSGAYKIHSPCFNYDQPKFHMGARQTYDPVTRSSHLSPGPGAHNPSNQSSFKQRSAPLYSMGERIMSPQHSVKHKLPGPGQYTNSAEKVLKARSPSFGFGSG